MRYEPRTFPRYIVNNIDEINAYIRIFIEQRCTCGNTANLFLSSSPQSLPSQKVIIFSRRSRKQCNIVFCFRTSGFDTSSVSLRRRRRRRGKSPSLLRLRHGYPAISNPPRVRTIFRERRQKKSRRFVVDDRVSRDESVFDASI